MHPISVLGMIVVVAGLMLEFVAVAGMAFYPIRRSLPVKSPITLQSIGCMTFGSGLLLLVVGELFA